MNVITGAVNFEGGWSNLWGAISSAAPGLTGLLTTLGVALVAWAVVKFFWDKRKGGGGDTSGVMWTGVLGAILSAPAIIMPIVLRVVDWFANAVLGILS